MTELVRKKHRTWGDKADGLLKQMFEAGCEVEEMAVVFGVSGSAIRSRMHKLALHMLRREEVDIDFEEFKRLIELRTGRAPE